MRRRRAPPKPAFRWRYGGICALGDDLLGGVTASSLDQHHVALTGDDLPHRVDAYTYDDARCSRVQWMLRLCMRLRVSCGLGMRTYVYVMCAECCPAFCGEGPLPPCLLNAARLLGLGCSLHGFRRQSSWRSCSQLASSLAERFLTARGDASPLPLSICTHSAAPPETQGCPHRARACDTLRAQSTHFTSRFWLFAHRRCNL